MIISKFGIGYNWFIYSNDFIIAWGPYHSPGYLPSYKPTLQILWIPNCAVGVSINNLY